MATGVSLSNFWLSPLSRPIPKTPYWVHALYLLHKASYSQFCVKIRDLSLPWQQGRSRQIFLTPLNVPTLNTPKLVQVSGLYVLHNLSYSYFCAEICKFSLPWQRGSLSNFWLSPLNRPTPKPPTGCKCMGDIYYIRRVIANFVSKFAIFRYHGNRVGLRKCVWRL